MPKQKHLNIRYTIRLSDYLSNEMIKHTLNSGQDYSSFIRMCITNYLKGRTQNKSTSDILPLQKSPMSATKTPILGVSSLNDKDLHSTPVIDYTDNPCSPSLYGWD